MAADCFFANTKPAWLLSYERTNRNVHVVASKFYQETDRNEKYWIKDTRERFMSKSDFHTISELKLWVRVLVFSVLNVNELHGLMH